MSGLEAIGWTPDWAAAFESLCAEPTGEGLGLIPARVIEEQRGALRCLSASAELVADVSGRLRHEARGSEELPGVGDWVAIAPRPREGRGTIHQVVPRRTALVRKSPGDPAKGQLLAANVDLVFVATSLSHDFRPRRIERTLAVVRESGARGVVVLTKLDLVDEPEGLLAEALDAAGGHPVVALSGLTGQGVDGLAGHLVPGGTVVLIGPSGVGKSTLANRLLGEELLATSDVRAADDKGRHTTTHRQLVALPGGGALIDTPGLREVGLWDDGAGVDSAFPEIEALLTECRFSDCQHSNEPGCALRAALEDGRIAAERWVHYQKLKREAVALEGRRSARGRHESRKKHKAFAKRVRSAQDKRRRPE